MPETAELEETLDKLTKLSRTFMTERQIAIAHWNATKETIIQTFGNPPPVVHEAWEMIDRVLADEDDVDSLPDDL